MADEGNQRFRCGFGKVNLKNVGATFSVWRIKPDFERQSATTTGKREVNTFEIIPVSAQPQIHGNMYRDFVTHPNNTIIMVQATHTRNGSPFKDGCVLLRLRRTAAMLNVVASLPTGPMNVIGDSFSVFQGNADILSVDEARVLGIKVPNGVIDRYFDPDEVNACFALEEIIPESMPRPTVSQVATPNGVVITEIAVAPTRRMRFRKPL